MKCTKCGAISDSKFCPNCGARMPIANYPQDKEPNKKISKLSVVALIFSITIFLFPIGAIFALIDLTRKNATDENHNLSIVSLAIVFLILIFSGLHHKDKKAINKANIQTETTEVSQTESEIIDTQEQMEQPVDYDSLSEDDYKAQCVQLYHDDIFFTEDDLEGKLVKVDLFLEEPYTFTAKDSYNSQTMKFVQDNDVQKDFFKCGVLRSADSMSYTGGQINLFFTNSSGLSCTDYQAGQHVTVYGQITGFSTNTWDGYNQCDLVAKYIDVN